MVISSNVSEKIASNDFVQGLQKKKCNLVSAVPFLTKIEQKGWILGYLESKRVKKITTLLSKNIAIEGLNGIPFYISLEEIAGRVSQTYSGEHHLYMIGSKASDYIDNTNLSNDIDLQIKFKKSCKIATLSSISQEVYHLFSTRSGIPKNELMKKILKETKINRNFGRFLILKFKSMTGMKYDISLTSFVNRKSLFVHDGRRLLLDALRKSEAHSDAKGVPILNPLKNGDLPRKCRDCRIIDALDPSTINFPGCLRLYSYYVKGWICKDFILEKEITSAFIKQMREDPKNNLQSVFKNDLDSHHKNSYGSAVAFVYNILAALLRHGFEEDYEKVHVESLAVLEILPKESLTADLQLVEEALLKGYPLAQIAIQSSPCRQLGPFLLIQYKLDNCYLITQFESPYKQAANVSEDLPLISIESAAIIPEVKKGKAAVRLMNTPEQWMKHLRSNRTDWGEEDINRLGYELAGYLRDASTLKPELKKALQMHCPVFMKELLKTDKRGKYVLPFYVQLIEKKISAQLDKKSIKGIIEKCRTWINEDNADPYNIQKIYSYQSQKIDKELSLWMVKAFLERKDVQEAEKMMQKLSPVDISAETQLAIIEGKIFSEPFKAIELLEKHRALLQSLPSSCNVGMCVVNAFNALVKKGAITPKQLNVLSQAAIEYKIKDGLFWLTLISKAVDIKNKNVINMFITTVSKYDFAGNDLDAIYECLSTAVHWLIKKHDPLFKTVISNAHHYFALGKFNSDDKLATLLTHVRREVMYLVKNDLATDHDYLLYYDFFVQYGLNDPEGLFFIEKFLSTPFQGQFIGVCEQLKGRVNELEVDGLLKFCKMIDQRKVHFPNSLICQQIKMLFDAKTEGWGTQEKYHLLLDWTIQLPSLIGVFQEEGIRYMKEVVNRKDGTLYAWELFKPIDEIIHSEYCGCFYEHLVSILNFLEKIKTVPENEILIRWEMLICRISENFVQRDKEVDLLRPMELFYAVFHKFDHDFIIQSRLIKGAVESLMAILKMSTQAFKKHVQKFRDYLSQGHLIWSEIDRKLENQALYSKFNSKMVDPVRIVNEYKFISMDIPGKDKMNYQIPSEEYVRDLQKSVNKNSDQWFRFAMGMVTLCQSLLETKFLGSYNIRILNFTAKIIEILMLSYPVIDVKNIDETQKQIGSLLLKYLMHNGDLSINSFVSQMTQAAHLHSCAIHSGYVENSSHENYFFYLVLDLSQLCAVGKPSQEHECEHYFLDYVNDKPHWNIYQIMRMLVASMTKDEICTNKEIINALKKAFVERCYCLPDQKLLIEKVAGIFQMMDVRLELIPDNSDMLQD